MTNEERLAAADLIPGWMNRDELRWLMEEATKRRTVVEFGSWKGRSTMALSAAGRVYAVDKWTGELPGHPTEPYVGREFLYNLWEQILGGRVIPMRMPTHYAAQFNRHDPDLEMVFIDAAHDYESVKSDIYTAITILEHGCMRRGKSGLLCGHDFSNDYPGVQQAVRELVPDFQRVPGGDIWFKEL